MGAYIAELEEPGTQNPTEMFYGAFTKAAAFYNERLFDSQLRQVMITVSRRKNMMGCFQANRWSDGSGRLYHEIALNPQYFAGITVIDILAVLVHEMAHQWQHDLGSPSRGHYHNWEFAHLLEKVGIITSQSGAPGGPRVGQGMSQYTLASGSFYRTSVELIRTGCIIELIDRQVMRCGGMGPYAEDGHLLSKEEIAGLIRDVGGGDALADDGGAQAIAVRGAEGDTARDEIDDLVDILGRGVKQSLLVDETPDPVAGDEGERSRKSRNKTCYQCPGCGKKAWGGESLSLACIPCAQALVIVA